MTMFRSRWSEQYLSQMGTPVGSSGDNTEPAVRTRRTMTRDKLIEEICSALKRNGRVSPESDIRSLQKMDTHHLCAIHNHWHSINDFISEADVQP